MRTFNSVMRHVDQIFALGLPYRKGSTKKLSENKKGPDFLFTFCRSAPSKEGVVFFSLMFYYHFFVFTAWSWVWEDDGETISVLGDAQRCIQGATGYRDRGLAGVSLFSRIPWHSILQRLLPVRKRAGNATWQLFCPLLDGITVSFGLYSRREYSRSG